MITETPGYLVATPGHPLLRIFVSFPIACFSGALATDVTYTQTSNIIWADFSAWLLAIGLAFGVLAAIVGVLALFSRRNARPRPVWPVVVGSLAVLAMALLNNLVHSRDAWTSVVPEGLALSAITVIVMLATIWFGSATVARNETNIRYSGAA